MHYQMTITITVKKTLNSSLQESGMSSRLGYNVTKNQKDPCIHRVHQFSRQANVTISLNALNAMQGIICKELYARDAMQGVLCKVCYARDDMQGILCKGCYVRDAIQGMLFKGCYSRDAMQTLYFYAMNVMNKCNECSAML